MISGFCLHYSLAHLPARAIHITAISHPALSPEGAREN